MLVREAIVSKFPNSDSNQLMQRLRSATDAQLLDFVMKVPIATSLRDLGLDE
jgi:hypothetical protein